MRILLLHFQVHWASNPGEKSYIQMTPIKPMGNSSVTGVTFLSCCDTEFNILFTLLLTFQQPMLCVLLEIRIKSDNELHTQGFV